MVAGRASESAGILLFRRRPARDGEVEVFVVHPGGPFFARKDDGAWSLPKGGFEPGEDPLQAARREFLEETGLAIDACAPRGEPIPLGSVRQRAGKVVHAWAIEGDWPDGVSIRSNEVEMEWPRGSGRRVSFPEIDRAAFHDAATAKRKLNAAQAELVDRLLSHLASREG
jgi:predicted NUDIX family NTP pyrophosphohydrolase